MERLQVLASPLSTYVEVPGSFFLGSDQTGYFDQISEHILNTIALFPFFFQVEQVWSFATVFCWLLFGFRDPAARRLKARLDI